MSRSNVPEDKRVDFCLYVDEFQNFSTDSFATIMSEARKYHLNLIVANQFTTQLTEEIRDAVFGNIGTIVSFRVGQNDVESLSRYFQPLFDGDDLLRIPNANTVVRTLIGGVPTQPFSMATLPPLGNPNTQLADALRQLSAAKYGQPRAVVEKAIFDRMATKPAPKPMAPSGAFNTPPRPSFGATPQAAPVPPSPSSGSFLDEWLAKQRAQTPLPPFSPPQTPAPAAPANSVPSPFQMPSVPPPGTIPSGNVSSAQLDRQEVDGIAQELKRGLDDKPNPSVAMGADHAGEVLKIQPTVQKPTADDDTIAIDNEGRLQLRQPAPVQSSDR
jgi:hypothetical protein